MEIGFQDVTQTEMKFRFNGELFLLNFQLLTQTVLYYSMEVSSYLMMILN